VVQQWNEIKGKCIRFLQVEESRLQLRNEGPARRLQKWPVNRYLVTVSEMAMLQKVGK